jgi:pyruvate dehydrogenase complex dehydrogenase (E1) component
VVPVCRAYDPAFAYEMGVIIEDGIHRMYGDGEDVFYYLTAYNENYQQPPKPEGVDQGIIDGLYRWAESPEGVERRGAILFSGSANLAARQAADRAGRTIRYRRRAVVGRPRTRPCGKMRWRPSAGTSSTPAPSPASRS